MEEYFPAPQRRYPSPSAQRRSGEHWKARFGLVTVIILTLCSAAIMFRIAGLGVGAAVSPLRGQPASAPGLPATAATAPPQSAAAQPAPPPPPAAPVVAPAPPVVAVAGVQATTAPTGAAAPSPTARPGRREHVVESGDTLSSISRRYNTTIDEIMAASNLRSRNDPLSVGQRLVIP